MGPYRQKVGAPNRNDINLQDLRERKFDKATPLKAQNGACYGLMIEYFIFVVDVEN